MTKPRIVLIANNIDELGGAQRVANVVADHLARRGYPVDLVGIAPFAPRHDYGIDRSVRRSSLMSVEWPAPPPDGRLWTRLRPSIRRLIATRAALRAEAIASLDVLLRSGPPGVIVTTQLWAMEHLAEVPHAAWAVVGQYHSSYEAAAAGRDLQRALDLYADVDLVTMLTAEDAHAMRRAGLNNVDWLPNPLSFWPGVPVEPSSTDAGVVTYLGRLSPEKGVTFLVEAWGRIADRFPGWRLRLVGSGPDEKAVRRQIAALPAGADRVDIMAPVTDAEAELRACDVFVLPSLTEGLPLALAEAMALGLPCVATDCSAGVRMLSRDGNAARIVPRGDAAGLAQAMSELMSSADVRTGLGREARDAVAQYRADVVIDEWEQLISRVLR
jgi:glycosyltransferase involved in cell wall biosynthesis